MIPYSPPTYETLIALTRDRGRVPGAASLQALAMKPGEIMEFATALECNTAYRFVRRHGGQAILYTTRRLNGRVYLIRLRSEDVRA